MDDKSEKITHLSERLDVAKKQIANIKEQLDQTLADFSSRPYVTAKSASFVLEEILRRIQDVDTLLTVCLSNLRRSPGGTSVSNQEGHKRSD